MFEPQEDIEAVVRCLDEALDAKRARITAKSEQTGFDKRGCVVFSRSCHKTFTFLFDKNGIFSVQIKLYDATDFNFNVGILSKNEQADDSFYYGIQPYITRAYT